MININRVKICVKTNEKEFGLDEVFDKKIVFVTSSDNTQGKSSFIEAIYYCLGLEELIGGKNEQALKPVFRSKLEYEGKEYFVLESEFMLQIKNQSDEVITLRRFGKREGKGSNLITVYYSDIDNIFNAQTKSEDMYVHLAGSATNKKGFHRFLEEFLGFKLPYVSCYDDSERKLYLQIIFSAFLLNKKEGGQICLLLYLHT